jgi:membrane protein involved in colicin uptake
MSEFERRIKELWARLTAGLSSSAKTAGRKRDESSANLRREATARAQQAAAKARDLRDSETAKKAASALHDLRSSETGKKAEAAIADLRQREPVKKAEESARKVLHDLFSGGSDSTDHSAE